MLNRIILVYNGDSGLSAMLLDVIKKATGREDCALCEITYSPVGKRRAWAACEARLGVKVEEMHRDRLPASWGVQRSELPVVLGRAGNDRPIVLLNREEISACHGRVEQLEARLRSALASASAPAKAAQS
jgi:hypothetical protein